MLNVPKLPLLEISGRRRGPLDGSETLKKPVRCWSPPAAVTVVLVLAAPASVCR
jgi:hypothetical protein